MGTDRFVQGLAILVVAAAAWAAGAGAAGQGGAAAESERLLAGAIDIHVHSLPDDRPRSIDAIDVAKQAKSRGMRGIVLKNHYESTAGVAYLVRTLVPGVEVFGGSI